MYLAWRTPYRIEILSCPGTALLFSVSKTNLVNSVGQWEACIDEQRTLVLYKSASVSFSMATRTRLAYDHVHERVSESKVISPRCLELRFPSFARLIASSMLKCLALCFVRLDVDKMLLVISPDFWARIRDLGTTPWAVWIQENQIKSQLQYAEEEHVTSAWIIHF